MYTLITFSFNEDKTIVFLADINWENIEWILSRCVVIIVLYPPCLSFGLTISVLILPMLRHLIPRGFCVLARKEKSRPSKV